MSTGMNNKQQNQSPDSSLQQFPLLQGTFSPTGTFNDFYSMLLPSNPPDRSQNKTTDPLYVFPDLPSWDSFKLPEKIDLIELTNKDLSPSLGYTYNNYCGNIESFATIDSQYNRFDTAQWNNTSSYGGIKSGSYPSCAEVNKSIHGNSSKSSNYCNIQKGSSDKDLYKSCAFYNSNPYNKTIDSVPTLYGNYGGSFSSAESTCFVQLPGSYDYLVTEKPEESQKENVDNYLQILEHHSEASNEESDIVVEDSTSDLSEEQDTKILYQTSVCLICNMQYTAVGLQFYVLNEKYPLTMSSQVPVKEKISEFIGKTIFSENNYLCNDCLGLVNSIDHLQLKIEGRVKDLMNKFKINRPPNYNIPNETHTKNTKRKYGRYKCKRCKIVLSVKSLLKSHIKGHLHKYLCELCGKISISIKQFKNHIKIHKNQISFIKAFKCSSKYCNKLFRTKYHLKEHENFCSGLLPFECKHIHCKKKFASSTKLKSHIKLKHDKKFIAICSICNIGFVKASDYKSHMMSHSTEKKFSCNKCDKSYKTLSNLNFHLKSHLKRLPYICTICQKGFVRKEYHEAHVNNHKGIKNYACAGCEKKFVSQKNLDAHMKCHDGTIKTNKCNSCKKIIASKFEEHLRTHSNYKEFDCDLCDMKFNTKNSLIKHKKRKHRE
ncbi:zinc finger protein 431-like [Anthonomus grandis grandis]|uniref:zinc finger protein 431-like n=1 Tax=Anthonomus grandis grandis TaxID=2921223 RepID=UPI002165B7AF|nr:zinc finger protein 431-like [Anthonomus grandis grandis]